MGVCVCVRVCVCVCWMQASVGEIGSGFFSHKAFAWASASLQREKNEKKFSAQFPKFSFFSSASSF